VILAGANRAANKRIPPADFRRARAIMQPGMFLSQPPDRDNSVEGLVRQ